MKLNLGLSANPKDTLRLWSTELRKRLFSSPEEFVWTPFDPTPAVIFGAGYTLDQIQPVNNSYCRHGKIVFLNIGLYLIITSGGGICSIRIPLPVKQETPSVYLEDKYIIGAMDQGILAAEVAMGYLQRDTGGSTSLVISKQNMAAMASGGWFVSFSTHYAAA